MREFIDVTGKTEDEAISKALAGEMVASMGLSCTRVWCIFVRNDS